jgi:hypothetical protein
MLIQGCYVCHENFNVSQDETLSPTSFSYTRQFEYTCETCDSGFAPTTMGVCSKCADNCFTCSLPGDSKACIKEDCSYFFPFYTP